MLFATQSPQETFIIILKPILNISHSVIYASRNTDKMRRNVAVTVCEHVSGNRRLVQHPMSTNSVKFCSTLDAFIQCF